MGHGDMASFYMASCSLDMVQLRQLGISVGGDLYEFLLADLGIIQS